VTYPNKRICGEDFIVDTGSPRTFVANLRVRSAEIDSAQLSKGGSYSARALSKSDTRLLGKITITISCDDGLSKEIETDALIFEDPNVIDSILGIDSILLIGKLVVDKTGAWFEI
jgi:hypothetical protein